MESYLNLLEHVLKNGQLKSDRTGTGTRSCFGYQLRIDLANGFPLVTTKKIHFKSIIYELLWFLKGDTNIHFLDDHGVRIWDEWADDYGDLGPVYGKQWRNWQTPDGHIDQISDLLHLLNTTPDSRRMIVSSWNVADLPLMALSPCHCLFQFYASNPDPETGRRKLSCQLYQRSADVFLGVPFNIASYALLCFMIAQVCGMDPGEFIHSFGDVHLYNNHLEQAKLQLTRLPFPLPKLSMNPLIMDLFTFQYEDFLLENYQFHPPILASVSV